MGESSESGWLPLFWPGATRAIIIGMISLKKGGSPTFSPDGKMLAVCSTSLIFLYDVESGECIREFKSIPKTSYLAFSPAGNRIVAKAATGQIAVFDLEGAMIVDFLNAHEKEGSNPLWSSDGTAIIDGSWDGVLQRRDATTGKVLARREMLMIRSLTQMQDGLISISALKPGQNPVSVLSFADPETLEGKGAPEEFPSEVDKPMLTPDGGFLVYFIDAAEPEMVAVNLRSKEEFRVKITQDGAGKLAFDADCRYVSCPRFPGAVKIFTLEGLQEIAHFEIPYPSLSTFSPDGKRICVGGWTSGILAEL